MTKPAPLHIPAPWSRSRVPGASYCGIQTPYRAESPDQMRRLVVDMVELGRAGAFCRRCLGLMLEDAIRRSDQAKAAAQRRHQSLTPERRREIARLAVAARWARYRERQSTSAHESPDPSPTAPESPAETIVPHSAR